MQFLITKTVRASWISLLHKLCWLTNEWLSINKLYSSYLFIILYAIGQLEEFKNQTFAKNNLCWILCFHIHTDCPILARNHHFHSASSDTLSPITMVDNCHVASIVASKQAAFANFKKNVKKTVDFCHLWQLLSLSQIILRIIKELEQNILTIDMVHF